MRIEKRGDEEWLVGSTGAGVNDCNEESPTGGVCDYHVDGQHVAAAWPNKYGEARVIARWPIVDASTSPAPRILTPVEVRAAQAPYVSKEIERINTGLVMGVRAFVVNAPLFEEIELALEAAGWSAVDASTRDGRTAFEVRERTEGER